VFAVTALVGSGESALLQSKMQLKLVGSAEKQKLIRARDPPSPYTT
jgi:hypothetical protein